MGQEKKLSQMLSSFWTVPNVLTLIRIILVPVFLWLMLSNRSADAFIVFLIAGATDLLDGFTARIWHVRSKAGVWLDPAADKLLLTAAFVVLGLPQYCSPNTLPMWLVVTVIGRDIAIAVGALAVQIIRGPTTFFPAIAGKISTVLQVITVLAVLLANRLQLDLPALDTLYRLTFLATVVSAVYYASRGYRFYLRRPRESLRNPPEGGNVPGDEPGTRAS